MYNILWMEYLPAFIRSPCYKSPKPGQPPLERMGKFFYHGFNGLDGSFPMRGWEQNKNKINPLERMEGGTQRTGEFLPRIGRISPVGEGMDQKVCCFPQAYALAARCVCSAMKASFPVCPSTSVWSAHWQTRKATKQNSCPWQYKMSLHRRLLTVSLDLRGACPQDASSF